MAEEKLFAAHTPFKQAQKDITGSYVEHEGERWFRIENHSVMPSFLMTIISASDLWMYISSNGALTAGRKNPDYAIFPYYTDDKITDSPDITGSRTILWVHMDKRKYLWEPFSGNYAHIYDIQRNIYKNIPGNKILFEEINTELKLTFRYAWMNAEAYGFIRRSELINNSTEDVVVELLDGVQNIIPYGTKRVMQNQYSNLLDAYKKNELRIDTGMGIYYLSSIPTDMAEPSEGLKATIAYAYGLDKPLCLISSRQADSFRRGKKTIQETETRAERGAYFIHKKIMVKDSESTVWNIIMDTGKDICDIRDIETRISDYNFKQILQKAIDEGTQNLLKLVAQSDGFQLTGNEKTVHRHFSNVLFNLMRGGIFDNGYTINKNDFLKHVRHFNIHLADRHHLFLHKLDKHINYHDLQAKVEDSKDEDLIRITMEYLPFTFSRRHGDPSRPWNLFSIEVKNPDGTRKLYYEGNWRDIFQNWEALSYSFPGYIEGMISRFMNASTADGYNPYRITRNGFDWERPDSSDPWSNIGYWGDHQIIYALKLLELSQKFHPGKLQDLLVKECFVYARVPYRIKSYGDLLIDPRNTIVFDAGLDQEIGKKVKELGEDGKLLYTKNKIAVRVHLAEKTLVAILGRLANFIPGGGIWMNTQRPEWNDANNALVGYGVSMVTVYYLRRYVTFCLTLMKNADFDTLDFSVEIHGLFDQVNKVLHKHISILESKSTEKERKQVLDGLGIAAAGYREILYNHGLSGLKVSLQKEELMKFFDTVTRYLDHTIDENRREDGMYHAYNLMEKDTKDTISLKRLYEMFEGQVAILSSGRLNTKEVVALLKTIKKSSLFRADQNSYMLYPARKLPLFMQKNTLSREVIHNSSMIKKLIKLEGSPVLREDKDGDFHFHGDFRNKNVLKKTLDKLEYEGKLKLTGKERSTLEELYEEVFNHRMFTGRSGTFFKYEGLGCIYWHMVSKYLLAVAENITWAVDEGADTKTLEKLKDHYHAIKEGIGAEKPPEEYGAFPSDPYSHTPGKAGVQQPGMTGQVKEDIITRFMELGIKIDREKIQFEPMLLKKQEFILANKTFKYYNLQGREQQIELSARSLAFTFCQVPVIYELADREALHIYYTDGKKVKLTGHILNAEISGHIFNRTGVIEKVWVYLKKF